MAIPAYAPIGLALALAFCIEMSLQTSYTADLANIINSNSAFVLGGVVGLTVTRLMRVIGTQASARRLIRATYRDLASLADGHALPTRERWASRMLDRVALLLYRQPRFEPRPQHEFADALEDLRLGVNMIETQSIAPSMSQSAQEALAAMFAGLAPHFRALARGRVPPFNSDLLQKVDIAINEVAACTAATHACVAAVVGLRRNSIQTRRRIDRRNWRRLRQKPLRRSASPDRTCYEWRVRYLRGVFSGFGGFCRHRFCCSAWNKRLLDATGFYRFVWHRALVDLAIYVICLPPSRRRPRLSCHWHEPLM